jgi:hypothetical protein
MAQDDNVYELLPLIQLKETQNVEHYDGQNKNIDFYFITMWPTQEDGVSWYAVSLVLKII